MQTRIEKNNVSLELFLGAEVSLNTPHKILHRLNVMDYLSNKFLASPELQLKSLGNLCRKFGKWLTVS